MHAIEVILIMLLAVAALGFIAWTAIRRAVETSRGRMLAARGSRSVHPKP